MALLTAWIILNDRNPSKLPGSTRKVYLHRPTFTAWFPKFTYAKPKTAF